MKAETLYDRAASNLKMAELNYKFITDDPFQLNLVGYLLQQATELLLKHYLEINAVNYPYTHDIKALISAIESNKIELKFPDNFYLFSDTLTKWEAKSRYIKNYFLERKEIEIGFKIVKELFELNPFSVDI